MTSDPKMPQDAYDDQFFDVMQEAARSSAHVIGPLLVKLLQPTSVIDVGCGTGTWLSVFQELGVGEVFGVDGAYVDRARLEIPAERFLAFDLTKPLRLDQTFDLAVSLEVAEHLPEDSADEFVESLTRLSPVVLFSAAIPHQGGTNHVNEQWPDYWAAKFSSHGFVAVDCLRRKVWNNGDVEWWYAQNMLLYVSRRYLDSHHALKCEYEFMGTSQLALVHPRKYAYLVEWSKEHSVKG